MARDISTVSQINLWGKQVDDGAGLEPQRTDLFFVDFTTALKNVAAVSGLQLASIIPQYVRSITLPEIRTKAEPIRRDSLPYNLPTWDDPLDAVKIVFLLDTKNQDDSSAVLRFLEIWLALTRAGRGARKDGYSTSANWFKLNDDFRVDFQFDLPLYLLRGANVSIGGFADDWPDDMEFNRFMSEANRSFRNDKKQAGLVQQGDPVPALDSQAPPPSGPFPFTAIEQDMVIHTLYILKAAWLAAYKVSDLSYTESSLVTVDTTFYVDSVDQATGPSFLWQARKLDATA